MTAFLQTQWERLLSSPQMLIIVVLGLFIAATLLLSIVAFRLIFRKSSNRKVGKGAIDPLTNEVRNTDRKNEGAWRRAPIALARMRFDAAPFERPEEPTLTSKSASAPTPAVSSAPAASAAELPLILYTLPFQMRAGLRPEHADLCGMAVEAVFFDPTEADADADAARRLVPFLPAGAGRVAASEGTGTVFRMNGLVAEPDAVIELSSGLVAVEVKPKGGRPDDPERWSETIREKDLLQTLAAAAACAHETGRPTAAVLRTANAVYFLRPGADVLRFLIEGIPEAERFWHAVADEKRPGIAALDYASVMSAPFAARWPKPEHEGHRSGRILHQKLLQS